MVSGVGVNVYCEYPLGRKTSLRSLRDSGILKASSVPDALRTAPPGFPAAAVRGHRKGRWPQPTADKGAGMGGSLSQASCALGLSGLSLAGYSQPTYIKHLESGVLKMHNQVLKAYDLVFT